MVSRISSAGAGAVMVDDVDEAGPARRVEAARVRADEERAFARRSSDGPGEASLRDAVRLLEPEQALELSFKGSVAHDFGGELKVQVEREHDGYVVAFEGEAKAKLARGTLGSRFRVATVDGAADLIQAAAQLGVVSAAKSAVAGGALTAIPTPWDVEPGERVSHYVRENLRDVKVGGGVGVELGGSAGGVVSGKLSASAMAVARFDRERGVVQLERVVEGSAGAKLRTAASMVFGGGAEAKAALTLVSEVRVSEEQAQRLARGELSSLVDVLQGSSMKERLVMEVSGQLEGHLAMGGGRAGVATAVELPVDEVLSALGGGPGELVELIDRADCKARVSWGAGAAEPHLAVHAQVLELEAEVTRKRFLDVRGSVREVREKVLELATAPVEVARRQAVANLH